MKDKKLEMLQKNVDSCMKKKCKTINKEKNTEHLLFEKKQDKQCPKTLSDMEFYDCSTIFYNSSDYKKVFEQYSTCKNAKCITEKKNLANYYFTGGKTISRARGRAKSKAIRQNKRLTRRHAN